MFQRLLKSRRILAILVVAVLALVQVKVAFADCMVALSADPTSMSMMGDCPRCKSSTAEEKDLYDAASRICSNHCIQSYAPLERSPEPLISATLTVEPVGTAKASLVNVVAVPIRVSPHNHAAFPGKARLIYRLQRLLI